WPGIADAAALAMMLRLHFGQVRPGWYTVEAWLVFAVASGIMVGANAIADRDDPLGGWMHAMVPVVAMLVWHVIIHGAPSATTETVAETADETRPAAVPKAVSKAVRPQVAGAAGAPAKIAEHLAAIRAAGGDPFQLSIRDIERATGVPRATVARHLPRVRGTQVAA
ncbi:MAG TPA: hypothetical protein VGU27_00595, partial [Candidatus Eisenbacteria bacterium]|nr:hypothetical protein [Candidatus Eisenbacteria bacterium]